MRITRWSLFSVLVLVLSVGLTNAQSNDIILQIAAPFIAEDLLQDTISNYEAQHPGVQVQLVTYNGFGSMPVQSSDDAETYQDDLMAYFETADILLVDDGLTPEATRAGYLLDLSPLVQSDPNYDPNAFVGNLSNAFVWDGGQWAVPISTNYTVLTYVPDAFDAAGLTYPTPNWTMDDLIFAAETLTEYNADGSVAMPGLMIQGGTGGTAFQTLIISLLGHGVYSDASIPSSPDYSDPTLAALMERWQAFEDEGLLTASGEINNSLIPMVLGNGQNGIGVRAGAPGAFGGQNSTAITQVAEVMPGGSAGLQVNGYAISSGTAYPQEAYELVKYLIQDPNAVALSNGSTPAISGTDTTVQMPGGGFSITMGVSDTLAAIVDSALANGLTPADMRFISGIADAFDYMDSEGLDAQSALDVAATDWLERLTVADSRGATTSIVVNAPETIAQLAESEIALSFGVLRGFGGGIETWQALGDEFAAIDAEVGRVDVDQVMGLQSDSFTTDYDCFYSGDNLVPELDLTTILSLDPLIFSDTTLDVNDYIPGILEQVQVNGQTYALPIQVQPLVLEVNTALFEEAGVPVPDGTWNVSQFEDALQQLMNVVGEGEAPLQLTTLGETGLLSLITIYGGMPFDLTTDTMGLNFTDPNTVAAIQQVLDLVKAGYISYFAPAGVGAVTAAAGPPQGDVAISSSVQGAFGRGGFGGPGGGNNIPTQSITFPTGNNNAVSFQLGGLYLSASSQHPEACYRFMSYVANSADSFNTMPTRYSLINSNALLSVQGQETVDFYNAMANLMSQPNTVVLPSVLQTLGFGSTNWLLGVFESYINDEVTDLATELQIAQERTQDFMDCIETAQAELGQNNSEESFTNFFQQVETCEASANA
ncbi:extracellular solute-binding protein [Phototrophicus methaneseepsis]|uniref:Extracellular solute-binding protein n=1 Tax=Phototrophicus methaneseepsis TaxID=2710758 RepID=A0A7S8IFV0_9CHLR|nr:extracellular solute-binding protein [Phototrophicus methaneseepsis]QPC84001.1 extracellular solute-binding protein [Phototrophicus methaneseepsis]